MASNMDLLPYTLRTEPRREVPDATDTQKERETVIQDDDGYEEASVYTCHRWLQNDLIRRGIQPSEESKRQGRVNGLRFYVPRSWIHIWPPRVVTEGQRQAGKEAIARIRQAQGSEDPQESPGPGSDPD